jgi:dTDP-glucose 4,6-dehydratase
MLHLISGGAGFLGCHLANALVDDGEEVVLLDDLTNGRVRNLEHSVCSGRATFVYAQAPVEVPELDRVIAAGAGRRVSRIYVLASPPHAGAASAIHEHAATLMQLARRHDARFLFASLHHGNVSADSAPDRYEYTVREAEVLTADAATARTSDARVVRLFDCFGPYMDRQDGRPVPQLIEALLEHRPLPLGADGSETFALTYAADAIEMLRRVMETQTDRFVPVEIGGERERSVEDIARRLARIAGVPFSPAYDRSEQGRPVRRRRAALARADALGWNPSTALDDGLRATYRWFARERRAYA